MAERQYDHTTEQRLRDIMNVLDAEGRELAAIYVSMALDRLDHRLPPPTAPATAGR